MRLLLLGGTREAVELAECLEADGHAITLSLAGRTREPRAANVETRMGGFGGAEGLAAFLAHGAFDALIDATHPFAATISANASLACETVGVPRMALHRPAWERRKGDDWRSAPDVPAAAAALPGGGHALLALGRQHLAPFLAREDLRLTARMIEAPDEAVAARMEIVRGRPSTDPGEEAAFLARLGVTHVVSRNSGGAGAYAKIEAARTLGLPVVMIDRPPPPSPPRVGTVGEVMTWLGSLRA